MTVRRATSTRDPDRPLAREAMRRLGLRGSLRRVATGLDTTYSCTLDDGRGRRAVRVAGTLPIRRPEAVVMEAAWIGALSADRDLRVPDVAGQVVVDDLEGRPRACLALAWLAGRKMRWRFATHHAHSLGAAAARLHRHAAGFEPPAGAWVKSSDPRWICRANGEGGALARVAGPEAEVVVAAVERRLAGTFRDLGATDWLLVNGDIGPHNAVWLDRSPGLFDFNDLGWGYAGWDLARYLHGLRWRANGPALVSAALEGYESVRPLPESFRLHGRLFEVAAGLFLANYLAPKVPERGEEAARTTRELVAKAFEFVRSE